MGGLERVGSTEPELAPELPGLSLDSPEAQGALMLFAYGKAHKKQDIDFADLERNDLALTSIARDEWVAKPGGKESLASLYRRYIEQHPGERVNTRNTEALAGLLKALVSAPSETRH
ncbi:TPA: hypothetical protein DIV48_00070 [Candidatus Kaiserbacteria bacterium]|nr:MAG: hypothetical protein UY93_C0002G0178 [Parcubacteria group bacterium GW2011_GWA1_56_13]KKW46770.1 MAG: hypothetical protein UY97_C0003G0044 [Parcubacteria group bacterium GW2011_GWB1_57_6]HCR52028.1 hypothetical protein [Candidatus Kaiserbacteria bacterium]